MAAEINYTAVVAKDLEDLIPVFLNNRGKEVESLRTALGAGDYDQLKQLGHRMKGVGNSYGFAPISDFGKVIEDSAKATDKAAIGSCIDMYADYLTRVKIVYE
jgi:HPt (histidine-containing phosphotransfer) domain-containing protein